MEELDDETNAITGAIVTSAMAVHKEIGPGCLESTYRACLAYELRRRDLHVDEEVPLPLVYGDVRLECGYRLDLLVEERVLVEVKCADRLAPIHTAQMLTYLRLANCSVGLILNFKVALLKDGIKRVINKHRSATAPIE